jgi:hypothetical protein
MVLSGARTSLHRSDLSLSPLQIVDQSFFPTIIISHPAIVTVQARTNGAAEAGVFRGIVQLCIHWQLACYPT